MSWVNSMHYLVEPGFFSSGPVHVALLVGAVIAITSAVVGVFTVTRGQSFAGPRLVRGFAVGFRRFTVGFRVLRIPLL